MAIKMNDDGLLAAAGRGLARLRSSRAANAKPPAPADKTIAMANGSTVTFSSTPELSPEYLASMMSMKPSDFARNFLTDPWTQAQDDGLKGARDAVAAKLEEEARIKQDKEREVRLKLASYHAAEKLERKFQTVKLAATHAPELLDTAGKRRAGSYVNATSARMSPFLNESQINEDLIGVCHLANFRNCQARHQQDRVHMIENAVRTWTSDDHRDISERVQGASVAAAAAIAEKERLATVAAAEARQADLGKLLEQIEDEEPIEGSGSW